MSRCSWKRNPIPRLKVLRAQTLESKYIMSTSVTEPRTYRLYKLNFLNNRMADRLKLIISYLDSDCLGKAEELTKELIGFLWVLGEYDALLLHRLHQIKIMIEQQIQEEKYA